MAILMQQEACVCVCVCVVFVSVLPMACCRRSVSAPNVRHAVGPIRVLLPGVCGNGSLVCSLRAGRCAPLAFVDLFARRAPSCGAVPVLAQSCVAAASRHARASRFLRLSCVAAASLRDRVRRGIAQRSGSSISLAPGAPPCKVIRFLRPRCCRSSVSAPNVRFIRRGRSVVLHPACVTTASLGARGGPVAQRPRLAQFLFTRASLRKASGPCTRCVAGIRFLHFTCATRMGNKQFIAYTPACG